MLGGRYRVDTGEASDRSFVLARPGAAGGRESGDYFDLLRFFSQLGPGLDVESGGGGWRC